MKYKIVVNGQGVVVKDVVKVIDRGDNFAFFGKHNEVVFILNKSEYSYIKNEGGD